ncbi:MAG: Helix-hairpin-helix motif containing protein [Phycisphaerales bacterium]|nr:Helix-hairpin-helix motif containing protein [Phycisphaerales bacterium]
MNRGRRQGTIKRNWLGRLLDAAQRRFRRARPGSVLVMVVALLVMLALIGTAAMSTARLDRMSAVQHTKNTQLDILADGVKNMAISVVTSDLFNNNGIYRDVVTDQSTYDQFDYPGYDPLSDDSDTNTIRADGVQNKSFDAWLGSRLPELVGSGASSVVQWSFLSHPPLRSGNGYQVDAPNRGDSGVVTVPKLAYTPTYLSVGGFDLPALQVVAPGAADPFGDKTNKPFLAGDADGDGVADSFYFKLATIGNITYYGCYRIIDNNSAINVNSAMVRDADFSGNGSGGTAAVANDGFFPTNIGMAEFLQTYNPAFTDLNTVGPEFAKTLARKNILPAPDGLLGGNGSPVDENNNAISTFKYRTVADAVYMGLGRRPDYPGHVVPGTNAQAFYGYGTRPYGLGDGFALAYRFCLSGYLNSQLELDLAPSMAANSVPYTPNGAAYNTVINKWYGNFDFDNPAVKPPVRSVFVSHNPTSNAAPSHVQPGEVLFPNMRPTPIIPVKISINTAPYEDLWRGFYDLMCTSSLTTGLGRTVAEAQANDNASDGIFDTYYGAKFTPPPVATPLVPLPKPAPGSPPNGTELHPGRMFRNPIRNGALNNDPRLTARQVMALRSAIAATNTIALREGSQQVTPRVVKLDGVNGGKNYEAAVFGYARQPFITEVFAHTDINQVKAADPTDPRVNFEGKSNPHGFVAVELHNPYDRPMSLKDWQLAIMNRAGYPRTLGYLFDSNGDAQANQLDGVVIPAGGYVVLHNYRKGADEKDPQSAQYIPFSIGLIPAGALVYVPELSSVLPRQANEMKELVLLRPVVGPKPPNKPTKPDLLYSMAPVDSFDFTGLVLPAMEPAKAEAWHYTRANDPAQGKAWAFVYPGRYNGTLPSLRHQGIESEAWDPTAPNTGGPPLDEPWAPKGSPANPLIKLGAADDASTRNPNKGDDIKDFQIQLANTDMPGPGPLGASNSTFPFGGFARTGDILQVPFIGAYTIIDPSLSNDMTKSLIEMNAVTMDSVFAEDTDIIDDKAEDIGRFCPVDIEDPAVAPKSGAVDVNDLDPRGSYALAPGKPLPKPLWHYHWTMRLFDYFTAINNPHDDYLPNIAALGGGPPAANSAVPNGPAVTNSAQANGQNEITTPVEGLININTAGWKVLSAIPFAPASLTNGTAVNEWVARSIVNYRDRFDPITGLPHGPFTSLFELSRVPIYDNAGAFKYTFQELWKSGSDHDADDKDGDFSPEGTATDFVRNDFEEKYLALNRISNLVTTRSDTFTAYICVQGWRNVGGNNATLEGQRRLAVIIDRSRITPVKKTPAVYNVPTAN